MSWSYSGDPTTGNKDLVRFRVGDTDTNEQLLSDEEINYAISEHSDIWGACAECAEAIASQFAKRADINAFSDIDIDLSQKQEHFEKMAERFRRKATASNKPTAISISKDDKQLIREDSDRVSPSITRGMHDND